MPFGTVYLSLYRYLGAPSVRLRGEKSSIHHASLTLAETSPETLYDEVTANPVPFTVNTYAAGAAKKPLLVVSSDDGLAPVDDSFANAESASGGSPRRVHLATEHSYSDMRIALEMLRASSGR